MTGRNRQKAPSMLRRFEYALLAGCCFLILLVVGVPGVWAANVDILTPQSGATVIARNPLTHLILRTKGAGNSMKVRVKAGNVFIDPVVAMEGEDSVFLHYRLPLKRGKNSFVLDPGGERIDVSYQPIQSDLGYKKAMAESASLFHRGDQLPESCRDCHDFADNSIVTPVGLQRQESCGVCHPNIVEQGTWQHSTTINRQCLSCHLQSSKPWKIGFPAVKMQEICFGCHAGKTVWNSRTVVHGPVYIGGCTLCHNPHGADHRYQLWAEGSRELCINCHSDKENLITKQQGKRLPYVHGIISGPGCVACHDPHTSNEQYMLNQPTNQLCLGCHPQIALKTGGHPVANHPVAAPKERRRPGRQLTCVSCHDPHGSMNPLMLIKSPLGGQLCRECHKR